MSWTCKRLTKKDIREVWFSGVFHKLYVSTREEIEAGKTYVYPEEEWTDEIKEIHWYDRFHAYASPTTHLNNDGENNEFYCLGLYRDVDLMWIMGGFINPNDNSWNDCHGIARGDLTTGSKAWIFMKDSNNAKFDFLKTLGANKIHYYAEKDSNIHKQLISDAAYSESVQYIIDKNSVSAVDFSQTYKVTIPETQPITLADGTIPPKEPAKIIEDRQGRVIVKITNNFQ